MIIQDKLIEFVFIRVVVSLQLFELLLQPLIFFLQLGNKMIVFLVDFLAGFSPVFFGKNLEPEDVFLQIVFIPKWRKTRNE